MRADQSKMTSETKLILSAHENRTKCVRKLLRIPNIKLNTGTFESRDTALHCSAAMGHEKITRMLLNRESIDINKVNNRGYTPLMLAVKNNRIGVARMLLKCVMLMLTK